MLADLEEPQWGWLPTSLFRLLTQARLLGMLAGQRY